MDDQRIKARAPLGRVNRRHGLCIGCVGGKPVNRLGRDRHGFATGNAGGPFRQGGRSKGQASGRKVIWYGHNVSL